MTTIRALEGRVVNGVQGLHVGSEEVVFVCDDGTRIKTYHKQDCCGTVELCEYDGECGGLVSDAIESTQDTSKEGGHYSTTATFYSIASEHGHLHLRWLGTSNGYYSERVDVEVLLP